MPSRSACSLRVDCSLLDLPRRHAGERICYRPKIMQQSRCPRLWLAAARLSRREFMSEPGNTLSSIETPALLVDLDLMEGNIRRWQAVFDKAGVAFRPHIKTHKSPAVAACQVAAGAIGLAVAKVSEAEVFAAAGFRDLSVAYPVVGESKWRRLAELARENSISV